MVTKGYGLTADDIDWSCPAELEPYKKAYIIEQNERDVQAWSLGLYFYHASYAATRNAIMNAFGKRGDAKYLEKPLMSDSVAENKDLSEEEKQKAVDQFFAQEKARRVNWRRNHPKKNEGDGV